MEYVARCISEDRYWVEVDIFGYSDEQLEELKKYVVDGEIDIDKMKEEDSIILVQNIDGLDYTNLSVGDEVQAEFHKVNENGELQGITFLSLKLVL